MGYALITGASKGIGKSIAAELAQRKFNVLLVARSGDLLEAIARDFAGKYKVQVDWLAVDLSKVNAAQEVYDWCQQKNYSIEILVNNAGYGLSGLFEKYSLDDNTNMMCVNMIVPVQLCQLFLPALKQQQKAYILNIASSAAYQAVPYLSVYAGTKAFVMRFSRGLRQEMKKTSVSVTCAAPGATDTDFVLRAQIGEKGLKTANKVNMSPQAVARIAVEGMFAGKAEVITGFINKLGAILVWLLPKTLVETTAMKIYIE
ncbi:MAG TPA: SDR family oxidoreductase [Puia sp.]|jgi:short-subunit dehydrogenase|nr:SDR family oxidoreductase [Puia sp.]